MRMKKKYNMKVEECKGVRCVGSEVVFSFFPSGPQVETNSDIETVSLHGNTFLLVVIDTYIIKHLGGPSFDVEF